MKKTQKKYFFVKIHEKGRNRYVDQDGKRVSREKVERSKRKVYLYVGSGINKGDLIDRKKEQKDKAKLKKDNIKKDPGRYIVLQLLNIHVLNDFNYYISNGWDIGVKIESENSYILKSEKSRGDFLLFSSEVNKRFFETFKKLMEYPFFYIDLLENRKVKKSFFNFSDIRLIGKGSEAVKVQKAFEDFKKYVLSIFSNYFK